MHNVGFLMTRLICCTCFLHFFSGILKIAEVSSRFTSTGRFVLEVEKMGFKIVKQVHYHNFIMHQSFGTPAPMGPDIAGTYLNCYGLTLLQYLQCRETVKV